MPSDSADLEQAERRRCTALMADDAEALAAMLADDLVHVHLNGTVDSKAGYLAGVREKYGFADVERGPLTVRVYGDVAVMTGTLTQKVRLKATGEIVPIRAFTTQTWLRTGDGWLLNTCHNAALPAPSKEN